MIDQPRSAGPAVAGDTVPVVISVPADKTYVALIRSATAHLGAREGFSVVEITDLRLAVDEACGLLLSPHDHGGLAVSGGELECRLVAYDGGLRVVVCTADESDRSPDQEGFGWHLLSGLVDRLHWSRAGGWAQVELVKYPAARTGR
ncbi:MAG: putative serine/threonine kinase anti-sigma factor [Actinomycetia bacterium]|nr:putative serine/threonine kinase anti-sigma factor [Actinomycetes bacterium]